MKNQFKNYNLPDGKGHFDKFGGKYVPETLIPALEELEIIYNEARMDSKFKNELDNLLKHLYTLPYPPYPNNIPFFILNSLVNYYLFLS